MALTLTDLVKNLGSRASHLLITQIIAFFVLCSQIRRNVLVLYPSTQPVDEPPPLLDRSSQNFLRQTCQMSKGDVNASYEALQEEIWSHDKLLQSVCDDTALLETFQEYGKDLYPAPRTIWPPTLVCINPACEYVQARKPYKLQGAAERRGILYTKSHGPIAVKYYHITCDKCKTNYHCDYYVLSGTQTRHYYLNSAWGADKTNSYFSKIPPIIQVGEHRFVEMVLAIEWRIAMVDAHTSGTNLASIYMKSNSLPRLPDNWPINGVLSCEHVYDTFKLSTLLYFYKLHQKQLLLPHDGQQVHRFLEAMSTVNKFITQYGQPEINHQCAGCVRQFQEPNGDVKEVFVVVCDGITIGRPACAQPHCKGSLISTKDIYCPQHISFNKICAIYGCELPIETGYRTCQDPDHRRVETKYFERGQASFQLRRRLEQTQASSSRQETFSVVNAEMLDTGDQDVFELVGEPEVEPEGDGQQRLRGRFSRFRTHNEQLIFAPCGMILSRETFHYSEAFSLVALLFYHTFVGRRIPNHFIFDSNCILRKYIYNLHQDHPIRQFFAKVGLSVDVFHFNSKHKKTDTYCQANCNPYRCAELLKDNQKDWYFNTSIAEQKNSWIGKYLPICREMEATFYEFFLNMMIMFHNEDHKAKLEREGKGPGYWQERDFSSQSQMQGPV